ncbi:hypothetical protein IV203_028396 [Nitzschia inconspicua]|uniref:SEA domain-containing protein n=2 Tax=Nitzschia inconspicua TaxID=303405 RepID=A0A9K3PZW2_9STRA|nr:hypothetical protein IV203_028396 [Nitzschia inconspicua]
MTILVFPKATAIVTATLLLLHLLACTSAQDVTSPTIAPSLPQSPSANHTANEIQLDQDVDATAAPNSASDPPFSNSNVTDEDEIMLNQDLDEEDQDRNITVTLAPNNPDDPPPSDTNVTDNEIILDKEPDDEDQDMNVTVTLAPTNPDNSPSSDSNATDTDDNVLDEDDNPDKNVTVAPAPTITPTSISVDSPTDIPIDGTVTPTVKVTTQAPSTSISVDSPTDIPIDGTVTPTVTVTTQAPSTSISVDSPTDIPIDGTVTPTVTVTTQAPSTSVVETPSCVPVVMYSPEQYPYEGSIPRTPSHQYMIDNIIRPASEPLDPVNTTMATAVGCKEVENHSNNTNTTKNTEFLSTFELSTELKSESVQGSSLTLHGMDSVAESAYDTLTTTLEQHFTEYFDNFYPSIRFASSIEVVSVDGTRRRELSSSSSSSSSLPFLRTGRRRLSSSAAVTVVYNQDFTWTQPVTLDVDKTQLATLPLQDETDQAQLVASLQKVSPEFATLQSVSAVTPGF